MRVLAVQVLLLAAGGLWAVVRTCLMVINLSVLDPCLGSWEDPGGSHPGSFEAQLEDPIWSDPVEVLQRWKWNGQGRAFSLPLGVLSGTAWLS